jgi:Xaa-Pro aminopeptidase
MAARDLDAVARNAIDKAGFGKYFTHSLGHGLGLHVHERPRISALSRDTLVAGNVITIEPGIYIPGHLGVRIEDDVLITADGSRRITQAPKELMVL